MKLKEDIKSISHLKANAASILSQLAQTHRPVVITQNGEARAVLQDVESYDQMKAALGILKLMAQSEKAIKQGKVASQEKVFSTLENQMGI